jgi:GNAT superfamily N-acetyltransferase
MEELRLEQREASVAGAIECTEILKRRSPKTRAAWARMGNGVAIFHGNDAAMTAARHIDPADIPRVEMFYKECGATDCRFWVSDHSDPLLIQSLTARGYGSQNFAQNWLKWLDVLPNEPALDGIEIHRVPKDGLDELAAVLCIGFGGRLPEHLDLFYSLLAGEDTKQFCATADGKMVGGGLVSLKKRIGIIRTASTLPQFRCRGIQKALLWARLKVAHEAGCSVAFSSAEIDSISAHNLMKFGFVDDGRSWNMVKYF